MVSDPRIEQAIEIGRKNKRTWELVRNWCAHVSIRKHGGVGLVEAQTGLPIGHHFLECPHAPAGGMAAWDLADTAVDFYDRNCVGCKFRQPVALPNISTLVAARDAEREKQRLARNNRSGSLLNTAFRRVEGEASPGQPSTANLQEPLARKSFSRLFRSLPDYLIS